MKLKRVALPWHLAELVALAGTRRRLYALHDGRPPRYGYGEKDSWGTDVESAGGECAVAWTYNLFWTPWARRPSEIVADVGTDVEVRWRSVPGWDMIAHPKDPDHFRIVVVYGQLPVYELGGWLYGHEAKQERYWGDPYKTGRPAFWPPLGETRSMETFEARQEQSLPSAALGMVGTQPPGG